MTHLIDTLAAIMGVVMSLGYYPQAWRMIRTQSAENVSRFSFAIFAAGTTTWLIYGLAHRDMTIIAGFILGTFGSWLVLILTFVYRKENREVANS